MVESHGKLSLTGGGGPSGVEGKTNLLVSRNGGKWQGWCHQSAENGKQREKGYNEGQTGGEKGLWTLDNIGVTFQKRGWGTFGEEGLALQGGIIGGFGEKLNGVTQRETNAPRIAPRAHRMLILGSRSCIFGRFSGREGRGGLRGYHTSTEVIHLPPHQCNGGCSRPQPLPGGGGGLSTKRPPRHGPHRTGCPTRCPSL